MRKEVTPAVHQAASSDDGVMLPAVPNQVDLYVVTEDPRYLHIAKLFEEAFNSCPEEANGRQSCKTLRKGDSVYVEIVTTFKLAVKGA